MKRKQQECCEMMSGQLAWSCPDHSDPFDCPDALITKSKHSYGIIIHDGGSSFIEIAHCPWCGTKLT